MSAHQSQGVFYVGLSGTDGPATIKVPAREFKVGSEVKVGSELKRITHIFEDLLYMYSASKAEFVSHAPDVGGGGPPIALRIGGVRTNEHGKLEVRWSTMVEGNVLALGADVWQPAETFFLEFKPRLAPAAAPTPAARGRRGGETGGQPS